MKSCSKCGVEKPIEEFYTSSKTRVCRPCYRAKNAAWQKAHPEKVKEIQRRSKRKHWRRHKYGLDQDEYDALLQKQGGVCAICRTGAGGGRSTTGSLFVDHDHETGIVRGLLCTNCNTALGMFADDPERLQAALTYLGDSWTH